MPGEKVLMHCCCGPCSSACIERLAPDYDITLFYYNPCIDDQDEYEKRKANLLKLVDAVNEAGCVGEAAGPAAARPDDPGDDPAGAGCSDRTDRDGMTAAQAEDQSGTAVEYPPVKVVEGKYDPENYLEAVKGLEGEPEGGARCAVCFRMRLMEAARYAKQHGFDGFTTTLTVSPHKNYRVISEIGREVAEEAGIEYYPFDFKKKDGFLHSIRLSRAYGLYRQDYCGCSFSRRDE